MVGGKYGHLFKFDWYYEDLQKLKMKQLKKSTMRA
jgi:hypothetical protein